MFKIYNEDKGKLVWRLWVVLLVEFIGTFAMVFEIIAPSAFHLDSYPLFHTIFETFIMKAIWVSLFIMLLIYLLRNVSVNLNPAVTLAEIATGHHSWTKGLSMIVIQFIAGAIAAEAAYLIAQNIGTWEAGVSTLDAVYPKLVTSQTEQSLLGLNASYVDFLTNPPVKNDWVLTLVPYFIEFALTFALLSSVIYGKKITHSGRPFVITITLIIIITIGIHTNNIALNPARLYGPAIISQVQGGAETLQYTWIFLAGELSAVALVFFIEAKRNEKEGKTVSSIQRQIRLFASEALVTKVRYEWVLNGNKSLETMTKDELIKAASSIKAPIAEEESRDDIEYDVIEFLIFGLENGKMPTPKKTKKPVAKKASAKKAPAKKKPVAKKPVAKKAPAKKKPVAKKPTLSKEEIAKRDAKRAALQKKAAKATEGKKISAADLKKMKMTDIYGVGPKIEEYFIANGIDDMVKLSKKNVNTMTKKFISELPALRSFTDEMKKDKIEGCIEEAKHVVEMLTK